MSNVFDADSKPPVIFLTGPTASGKTGLAINLAEKLPVDLISVDSGMIYREMNIGTAKPTADELAKAPHSLIDILNPDEAWSAQDFRELATALIEKSHDAGRVPLLVGGTFLYFRALEQGLDELPAADAALRATLKQEWDSLGAAAMYKKLQQMDAATAERLHANDRQRVLRALEISISAGQPMSQMIGQASQPLPWNIKHISLIPENRAWLHQRIAVRTQQMFDMGLIEEVVDLLKRWDLNNDHNAIRCVGYRQVRDALNGELPIGELPDRVLFATRQYAKRQLTWLRSWHCDLSIDPESANPADSVLNYLRSENIFLNE